MRKGPATQAQQGGLPEVDFPCPPKLKRWLEGVRKWLEATQVVQGIGTTIDETPRGRVITAAGAGGGEPEEFHPFQLVPIGAHEIRVVFGTVNSEVPTGMSLGDEPQFTVTVAGTGVIYLEVTTDLNGDITEVTIEDGASMPPGVIGTWRQMIGSFTHVGGVVQVAQNILGSQALEVCGGVDDNWGLV